MKNKNVSIIIPVFNNIGYTKKVINWFHKNSSIFEIVVVNNGSTNTTKKFLDLKQLSMHNLVVIHNDNNLGFGRAVNQGIEKSKGDWVVILNNDIVFKTTNDDWIESLVINEMELAGPTGGLVDGCDFVYETNDPQKKINYMSGWCLGASKNTWLLLQESNASGPFDDSTFFCYFEDTDLSFRATQKNITFRLVDIPIKHIGKQTSKNIGIYKLYLASKDKFKQKWNC